MRSLVPMEIRGDIAVSAGHAIAHPRTSTLSIAAAGGNRIVGGTTLPIECIFTSADSGPSGILGGPTHLSNNGAGDLFSSGRLPEIEPGAADGPSNSNALGGPGPGLGGLTYIFGPIGLGPYRASTSIIKHIAGAGEEPATLAAGEVMVGPGPSPADVHCEDVPASPDTTRFRDDPAGMGSAILRIAGNAQLSIPTGTGCDGGICTCDGLGEACGTQLAAEGRPAESGAGYGWSHSFECGAFFGSCGCASDLVYDQGRSCNGHEFCSWIPGHCEPGTPPVCPGTNECRVANCNPLANDEAGGCVLIGLPNSTSCKRPVTSDRDRPDSGMNCACMLDFSRG